MLSIRVSVQGLDALRIKTKHADALVEKGLEQGLMLAATILHRQAIDNIRKGSKTGKKYPRGVGKFHQASAKGESPATDTGNLVKNIIIDTSNKKAIEVGSTSNAPYGARLELNMDREWLMPAFEQQRDKMVSRVEKAINDAIKRAYGG